VIFVDDFAGTGNQFMETWKRRYLPTNESFATVSATYSFKAFYCPLFCTRYAYQQNFRSINTSLVVQPAHWLGDDHSVLSANSIWWPDSMKSEAIDFIETYSEKIGLPDTGGYVVRDWQGFHKLGLAIAFPHCCPDATIPLFDTTEGGWSPLWSR